LTECEIANLRARALLLLLLLRGGRGEEAEKNGTGEE